MADCQNQIIINQSIINVANFLADLLRRSGSLIKAHSLVSR